MLYADVATLITQTCTVNAVGDSIPTETSRQVYVEVKSVGLKRKVDALAVGLNIDTKFVLASTEEYKNEKIIEYHGVRYNVKSVYIADDQSVELLVGMY